MLERLVAATSVTAIRGAPAAVLGVWGDGRRLQLIRLVPTRIPPGALSSQGLEGGSETPRLISLEDNRSLSEYMGQVRKIKRFCPNFRSGQVMTHCSHLMG